MRNTEDLDIDKLIHELDMNPKLNDVDVVEELGDFDCFVCALVQWVRENAYRFAFGAEQCIADRLDREHQVEGIHAIERRIRKLMAYNEIRRELHRQTTADMRAAIAVKAAEVELLEARLVILNERLRASGVDPYSLEPLDS